jgi:ADP-ribosylglycohydrolase
MVNLALIPNQVLSDIPTVNPALLADQLKLRSFEGFRIKQVIERAQGCLLGQLTGDALGSLVEFKAPFMIRQEYPNDVRDLADGGTWNTIAGQPTDDSEMALLLARMLVNQGTYDFEEARKQYIYWLNSDPFNFGATIARGLNGQHNPDSQANGAMMRFSKTFSIISRCSIIQNESMARMGGCHR